MKRTFILISCAALIIAACNKQQAIIETTSDHLASVTEYGTLAVNMNLGSTITRAESAYNTMQSYEKQVNTIEILIFNNEESDKGVIHGYYKHTVSSTEQTENNTYTIPVISVATGNKLVYAVVNSPDDLQGIKNITEFRTWEIQMEDNRISEDAGFVMVGSTDADISASHTETNPLQKEITVSRLAARLSLVNVVNKLPEAYGDLSIDQMYLTDVVGNWTLGGSASATTRWDNPLGREAAGDELVEDDKANIIGLDPHESANEELYWSGTALTVPHNGEQNLSNAPRLFYAYPNNSIVDITSWPSPFSYSGARTRLVLSALIDTKGDEKPTRFYYPIVIPQLEANKTYDISVAISGFGVLDPAEVIEKGVIEPSIKVNDWVLGEAIDADF